MEQVLSALGRSGGLTIEELSGELNHPHRRLEKALKLLEVDAAVEREGTQFLRTANRWTPDLMRSEQVTQHRRAELAQIKSYVEYDGCLMEFLARALDDPAPSRCGRCMNCARQTKRRSAPAPLVQMAVEFLRSDALVLEPRRQWPKPLLDEIQKVLPAAIERFENGRPKVMIPETLRAQEGRVLCIYGDAGWGQEVATGKYQSSRFSDALVSAAAELIRQKWNPQPPPQWLTAVPSQRHPELVEDFAQRLSARLGLLFVLALCKKRETRPQKEMQNSAMQLRNVLRAFQVIDATLGVASGSADAERSWPTTVQNWIRQLATRLGSGPTLPPVPVLLIDDVVDSRWTLTLGAVLLRQHGSGPVYPFALAKASLRGS